MTQPTWDRVKKIFNEAAPLSADERVDYLDRVCGADDHLRTEVEALLQSHDELSSTQSDTMTQAMPQTEGAGSVVGRYKLLQRIGEGGFGSVYMAEQEKPVRRRVALKIIKLGMDTRQVIARFEAERQALALMDHPNIAKVLDAGATEAGRPYFVMELVRGVPITEYCDQNKLGTDERLDLFMAVCGAVQHAHQKGVIHRDIKPSNVMVTLHDGRPVPKIIDFGIAKATNQRLTERTLFTEYNQFIGTPAYMSPEQAEMSGLDVDTRSDIYSLGVLLYELLTGTTPIESKRLKQAAYTELQQMIREEEPHRPSVRISTMGQAATTAAAKRSTDLSGLTRILRGDLDWIVMKALEKDRTRRYETANAMRRDLERYLANEPVSASPPGAFYRLRKFAQRNRVAVAVGAVVALALISGLLLAGLGMMQARREAAAAQQINTFFSDMLASVDPRYLRHFSGFTAEQDGELESYGELAHDVSVVDMMLRSRDRIASSFDGKPKLEARARETLGLSLLGLGRPREAAEELSIAARIRRDLLGADHPDTLRSELQHAMSLTESGRAPESVPLLKELREKMIRAYGKDDPKALKTSSLYATALMADREHVQADPIFRETLERQKEILGPEHRDTIET
ncbi:MAG: serine/threonine protein kinase, partial [Acidobacteriota bacterium]